MQDRLKPFELVVPEFACLMGLLEADGSMQTELGRLTGAPEYSTSRYVDRLVQRGLAERRPHPKSRRATCIFLTDEGKTIAKQMPALVKKNNDCVLSGLSLKERKELELLLQTAVSHLR